MKHLWNWSKVLANRLTVSEIKLFVLLNSVGFAGVFLLAFFLAVFFSGNDTIDVIGVGALCTVLTGSVLGLFGSILWMLRNEERLG